ncbi:hypothetical protein PR048_024571 [Dryococelus australis]|uniref:Uncharacterized protein n=1 Tax=Dryococelus australis TaxID=614101 RepID=A0ABQ9GNX4_9NEOP|nr:hypothetical protein PR048_024571 [Dryococelus australis]
MVTFHPATHYASVKPGLSRVAYSYWNVDNYVLTQNNVMDIFILRQCSVFYLREDTPLPCSPEGVVAHSMRILLCIRRTDILS